ncbi:MAG TPA: DUF885 domain-containing protein [Candidatus Eremiobacteraceae bacterium]|nr:DUF885 domain-containing protein [Candidatus Eremiobacteraceae bacterium]
MRRLALAAILAILGSVAPGSAHENVTVAGTAGQYAVAFSALVNTYLKESEARDPLFADSIGIHTHDDALPDYSAAANAEDQKWLQSWRDRFAGLDPSLMSADDVADQRTLLDGIDSQLFEEGALHPEQTDPTIYVGAIGDAAYQLTSREYAPLDERMKHVAVRMRLIPQLVKAAEENLKRPPLVFTQLAIDQNAGNIDFYQNDVVQMSAQASPATHAAVLAALPTTIASLKDLQAFLSGPLLKRSDGNPRVGAAVFNRDLKLVDGTDTPRDVLVARAKAAFAQTREQMFELAQPLDKQLFPGRVHTEKGDALIDAVVGEVLDKLADDHPTRDQVFSTAKADVAGLMDFLRKDPVVVLPSPDTLKVVPTPAFKAGIAGAGLDPTGPFTPLASSFYYIDRIPADWTQDHVTSYLRDYNDYEMQILSLHEAVPGHYVQFRYNAQVPSLVRRVFANGSFVEGWAVYSEGMMMDSGYGNHDPRLKLFQLKWRLREYSNAIIDAEYHTGDLTESQCVGFLEQKAFQDSAQAVNKWHRLEVSHDQLSSYFVGLDAITQERNAEMRSLGNRFSVADFNARLLAMGSTEPRAIATLMQQHQPAQP